MFSDPKYSFSVCQKYFFAVSKKVSIFHHSEPRYAECRMCRLCEQVGVPVPDLGISLAGGGVVDCVRGLVGATPECRDCVESLVCCVTDSCR